MSTKTIRLTNFLLDTGIYIIMMMGFFYLFQGQIDKEQVKTISIVFYFLYYFIFELATRRTPGKLITKTSIKNLGTSNNYYPLQILVRTLMRFIPIDILSYLFYDRGLHDWISKTSVTNK